MFSIYADNIRIHNDASPSPNARVISPKLTLSDNASGSLTMTIPHNNVGYSTIKPLATEIRVTRNGADYWFGRVIEEQIDWNNNRILTCEGALGYLNDTIQPRYIYETVTLKEALNAILSVHNAASSVHKFQLGTIDEDLAAKTLFFTTGYETTLSCLKSLVEKFGGHLTVGRLPKGQFALDYISDFSREENQEIAFRRNLLDISTHLDTSKIVTAVLPRGHSTNTYDSDVKIWDVEAELGVSQEVGTPPNAWYTSKQTIGNLIKNTPAPWELWYRFRITCNGLAHVYKSPAVWIYRKGESENLFHALNGNIWTVEDFYLNSSGQAVYRRWPYDRDEEGEIVRIDYGTAIHLEVFCDAGHYRNCYPITACIDDVSSSSWPKKYVTIESVNDGVPYIVNETLREQYGFIETVVDFPGIYTPRDLLAAGTEYLNSMQFEAMTYEVSAFDLSYIDPSAALLDLYDLVHCVSPPHGIDVWLPITKLTIPLDAPQNTTYTVGTNNNEAISSSVESTESTVHNIIY